MWSWFTFFYLCTNYTLAHSLADFQFPILPWEEFGFVEPRVRAVFGQAGVKSAHIIPLWDGVTVRVGVAEEDFEGARGHKDE